LVLGEVGVDAADVVEGKGFAVVAVDAGPELEFLVEVVEGFLRIAGLAIEDAQGIQFFAFVLDAVGAAGGVEFLLVLGDEVAEGEGGDLGQGCRDAEGREQEEACGSNWMGMGHPFGSGDVLVQSKRCEKQPQGLKSLALEVFGAAEAAPF
jgi:hypothetical protein